MTATTVGIIANPASARDIRRIVAHGQAVTTFDKLNRLQCVLTGLGAAGADRVLAMADGAGIMGGLQRLAGRTSAHTWPTLDFVDQRISHTALDTTVATQAMLAAGVGSIVVLGGDGTNGIVAADSADVPLVSLSTGTNNAFPQPVEATVAGLAAGLVAQHDRCCVAGTYRAKRLTVRSGDRIEAGLVDVAVTDIDGVGSGAIWDPALISELFLTFAEPHAIGLSAIGAHVRPTSRRSPDGLHVLLSETADATVRPPIAPGLFSAVGVRSANALRPSVPVPTDAGAGVVAIDGERRFRFGPDTRPTVTLLDDGPVVVDAEATLDFAASEGFLIAPGSPTARSITNPIHSHPPNPIPRGSHHATTQPT